MGHIAHLKNQFLIINTFSKMGRVNTEGQQTTGDQKSSAEWFELLNDVFLGKGGRREETGLVYIY